MSETNKSFRIRTNILKDSHVSLQLTQDYDLLEILSLKIRQIEDYKVHMSNYGVIVGRVLANDGFGVPNAKVSVFIPIENIDLSNSDITNLYSFTSVTDTNRNNIRYNLLPNESEDICLRAVGTFPHKRAVLDDESTLEVYNKYYKYTTTTNGSGDYMIFGVPIGEQKVHVDLDLSDVGILSQKPRDLVFKGHELSEFDSPTQFKSSTNLNDLTQIISEDKSVIVYPFWGDTSDGEIAISRCDVQIQYKFEPTCLFLGSVMTDNNSGYIGGDCKPSRLVGVNRTLIPSVGTIEMIRKTVDGLVEEYPINGNRLINEDGVWCYQIPMNLDYIVTDEFGNIVPSDNPNKGIPTRASVRFRFTVGNEESASSKHRARYLVPSNPDLDENSIEPKLVDESKFEEHYQFGSSTLNSDFRDLYWNKVYSVKNYIPRIQMNDEQNTSHYFALKRTNSVDDANPFPYNTLHYNVRFSFWILCYIIQLLLWIITIINEVVIQPLAAIVYVIKKILGINIKIFGKRIYLLGPIGYLANKIPSLWCIGLTITENDYPTAYFPGCDFNVFGVNFYKNSGQCQDAKQNGGRCSTNISEMHDKIQRALAQEFEIVHTDLANDWLNGTLYFPLWYWEKKPKKTYLFGLFRKNAKNTFCSCDNPYSKLRVFKPGAVTYSNDGVPTTRNNSVTIDTTDSVRTKYGLIKEFTNRDNLKLYYYSFGNFISLDSSYVRLFSTDIILLGSLNDCDVDDIPKFYNYLPSSTNNEVPLVSTSGALLPTEGGETSDTLEVGGVTGMDWGYNGKKNNYKGGLYIDLSCGAVKTQLKSCINASRICELGVMQDMEKRVTYANGNSVVYEADGMITKFEIFDNEARSMFATMNHIGFDSSKIENKRFDTNGYYVPKYSSLYPMEFDGGLNVVAPSLSSKLSKKAYDVADENYLLFRNGEFFHSYQGSGDNKFPLFNNSFYFYFGLSDGKTAIDVLNDKFLSPCTSNKKFPFTITTIGLSANTYCSNDETYHSAVEFEISDITKPYSFEFTNPYGIKLDSVDFIDEDTIILDNGGYGYEDGIYTLTVYDANGRKNTEKVNFTRQPIYAETYVEKLGTLYDGSNKDYVINTNNYGDIGISHIYIDGFEYDFHVGDQLDRIGGSYQWSGTVYAIDESITPSDIEKDILITITCEDSEPNWLVNKPNVDNPRIVPDSESKSGFVDLEFDIWLPSTYTLEITQMCNGNVTENIYTTVVTIENGSEFEGFLNDVPMSFLLDNNSGYKNGISWWISGVGDPSTYAYNVYDNEKWEAIIDIANYDISNSENTINFAKAVYNFKSMMSLLNASQIGGNDASSFAISHNGGKDPVIYKGYHATTDFDETEVDYNSNKIDIFELEKSGNGVFLSQYPSIVTRNYQYFNTSEDREAHSNANNVRTNYEKNKYYHDSMSEVFLGLFTDDDGYDIGGTKNNVVRLPKYALQLDDEPRQEILYTDKAESDEYLSPNVKHLRDYPYNDLQRHLICYSVDKRLSYDIKLVNCGVIKNISGNITNGIMLAYDENKNILSTSNTTEYTYEYANNESVDITSSTITWNQNAVKKLYKFSVNSVNLLNDVATTAISYPNTISFDKSLIPYTAETFDKTTITITPCSYDIDFNSEFIKNETSYTTNMSAIVKKGEDIKIKIDTTKAFTFFNNTIEGVAAKGNPPIIYNRNDMNWCVRSSNCSDNRTTYACYGGNKLFVVPNTENGSTTQDVLMVSPRLVKKNVINGIQNPNEVESAIYNDQNSLMGQNDMTYSSAWQFRGNGSNAYATSLDDGRYVFESGMGDVRIGFNGGGTKVINKSSSMANEETMYGSKGTFKYDLNFLDFYITYDVIIYPSNSNNLDSKVRVISNSRAYHIPKTIDFEPIGSNIALVSNDTSNNPYISYIGFKIKQTELSNHEQDELENTCALTARNSQNGNNEYKILSLEEYVESGVTYYKCEANFSPDEWTQAFREETKEEAGSGALFGAIVVKSKTNNLVYAIHLIDDGEPLIGS